MKNERNASITEYIKENLLCLDGGMGTTLHSMGLGPGELPERWNLTHPERIREVHKSYFDAGANVVCTNTFGANLLKFDEDELERTVKAAIEIAQSAKEESSSTQPKWVALDIGPSGKMLSPLGDLDFEEAVRIFSKTAGYAKKYGADLIFIETMSDVYEAKAATLAAKESTSLPVFVSCAYGEDGKLMTGASPEAVVAMLEGLGADAVGANCSLGPDALSGVIKEYLDCASVPVILKPNAGLPRRDGDRTVYDVSPERFACDVARLAEEGVSIVGGCCGTTPEYIRALKKRLSGVKKHPVEKKNVTVISSYTHATRIENTPVLIGERINPTGKARFKQALREGDINYVLREAIAQEERGVSVLDVNVGLPDIDEKEMLVRCVREIQAVTDLPLQLDTSSPEAMEAAMRVYNGKPLINSVNGKEESMAHIFPLVKKYGGTLIALTLDEHGIPAAAEGRVEIAKRILSKAAEYGIDKKDIIFDPLALTVSADGDAANQTLKAVRMISETLGAKTSLGVSNVSFGLPSRDAINSTFFALALGCGLNAAIINPYSSDMMKTCASFKALTGKDENCAEYIRLSQSNESSADPRSARSDNATEENDLRHAIIRGLREKAAELTRSALISRTPLDIIREDVIPALDEVGVGFEKKTIYLPSLLMSAEAAKEAFEVIKASASDQAERANRFPVVLATVKGDIHDIGKNIVKLLLENYGFDVIDLGKDVPPETIVQKVLETGAPLLGLSALMTTTVDAMQETIKLAKELAPFCHVMVGGAVLTEEYANIIGADKYASDAMEGVRYAEELWNARKC